MGNKNLNTLVNSGFAWILGPRELLQKTLRVKVQQDDYQKASHDIPIFNKTFQQSKMVDKSSLERQLALKAIELSGPQRNDIERYCWMVVHEHHHGVMPVEYDIRDIDEDLYLNVLKQAKINL